MMSKLLSEFINETTPRSINDTTTLEETVAVNGKRVYLDRVRDLIMDEEIRAAEIELSAKKAVNDAAEIALSVQRAENEALRANHERKQQHEALRAYHNYEQETRTKDKDTYAGFINPNLSHLEDISEGVKNHDIFDVDSVSTRRSDVDKGIIRECMKDLFSNMLETTDIGETLDFSRRILRLAKFEGQECPLHFLTSEARYNALKNYVNKQYRDDGVTFSDRYSTLRHHAPTFVKHLTEAAIASRSLTQDHYLDHCRMGTTGGFSCTAIENYLARVRIDIKNLPTMTVYSTIRQILDGLQPLTFKELILRKCPWIMSDGSEGAIERLYATIEDEYRQEQVILDRLHEGYGATNKDAYLDNNDDNDEKVTQHNNGGGYGKAIQCFNCSGDHKIGRCTELCKKCIVPCGKKPSDCPGYLKYREKALQLTGFPRDEFLNKKYSSNNAKLATELTKKIPLTKIYRIRNTPTASVASSDSDDSCDDTD